MASSTARVSIRVFSGLLLLIAVFYIGRPLYWKLSATIHEIRENRTTIKEGISQFVLEAQRTVGWVHDELNSAAGEYQSGGKDGVATSRRILRFIGGNR